MFRRDSWTRRFVEPLGEPGANFQMASLNLTWLGVSVGSGQLLAFRKLRVTVSGAHGDCWHDVPSPSRFTYDFSIWYCLHDDSIASCISMLLKKQGLRGYDEHQDQVAGTSILMTAAEVIQASRVAIVILSASSLDDPWCQRVVEWNLHHVIEQEGTRMIPIYVDVEKEQVPLVLRHLNELDYRNKFFERRLLESLKSIMPPAGRARAGRPSKATSAKSRASR